MGNFLFLFLGEGAGTIRSLVNVRVLHESLLIPVLICGSETMICKEWSRITDTAGQLQRFAGYHENV